MQLLFLSSMIVGVTAQNYPQPDDTWPATIKYDSEQGCNTLAGANEVFLRPAYGCNPTPTGTVDNDLSWYAVCSDQGTKWTISWFNGLECSDPDYNQTRSVPEYCDVNDKNEYESAFCWSTIPADQNPLGDAKSSFPLVLALTAADDCDLDSLVMYQFIKTDKCINRPGNTSEKYTTDGTTGTINQYSQPDCAGPAASPPPQAQVGNCFPGGPNIYALLITLTSGIPGYTFPTSYDSTTDHSGTAGSGSTGYDSTTDHSGTSGGGTGSTVDSTAIAGTNSTPTTPTPSPTGSSASAVHVTSMLVVTLFFTAFLL